MSMLSCYSDLLEAVKRCSDKKKKRQNVRVIAEPKKVLERVTVWKDMTIEELANGCKRSVDNVIEALSLVGVQGNFRPKTPICDTKILIEVVKKLGRKCEIRLRPVAPGVKISEVFEEIEAVKRPPPHPSVLVPRHPVVTIMGHVDHGKTTLLDSLRNTSVVDSEFGGITQHIGAFNVTLSSGEKITFLDTPGHAAFKAMRERGAHATDIVVLVVAADDGVMEQTLQSISMARDANVPMIVAINKIDKPNADIERTKRMLSQHGVIVEDLGGDVQSVNISALKGLNLDQLKDAIVIQAEVMSLKGDPTGPVEAVVIEASTHPGRGKVATSLIQRGTLKRGTVLVSGLTMARVRAMYDHAGSQVEEARLSDAVQIIGWKDLPSAGDEILEVESERKAHEVIRARENKKMQLKAVEDLVDYDKRIEEHNAVYKEKLKKKRESGMLYMRNIEPNKPMEKEPIDDRVRVNVIIKGDVAGSVEAILDVLVTYTSHNACLLDIVHHEVGPVTETDLELAKTFNAVIYCFNTDIPRKLDDIAKKQKIEVRRHNVIYKLIDDLKDEISRTLPKLKVDEVIGEADVMKEFEINEGRKKVKVAGCRCTKGVLKKSGLYKLVRDGEVIYRGKLSSMRHLKSEVDSIKADVECGLRFVDQSVSFQPGDTIVCYKLRYDPQYTDWNPGF
ncbi:translation initiation factor IF-2, mitochondrial isoform X1 [Belonocnema kinseyi]|uniref:translation initiation factor IF-2, mitochondrial isoform X1 n=1 Tax=Belonocnema kinseyi TaxID=2817044 RepID=UPI00143D237F|nr:translation initiation factor IF-2, mitochondrial isoform X1 [Belonocnema kinseyi]